MGKSNQVVCLWILQLVSNSLPDETGRRFTSFSIKCEASERLVRPGDTRTPGPGVAVLTMEALLPAKRALSWTIRVD